jgi:hypothetical protein
MTRRHSIRDVTHGNASDEMSSQELFEYRETHGGKSPPGYARDGSDARDGAAVAADGMSPQELFEYRETHGGKNPPGYAQRGAQ